MKVRILSPKWFSVIGILGEKIPHTNWYNVHVNDLRLALTEAEFELIEEINNSFTKEQILIICETILESAIDFISDRIISHLNDKDNLNIEDVDFEDVIFATGNSLSLFYAKLNDDGISSGDALSIADNFYVKVQSYITAVASKPQTYKCLFKRVGVTINSENIPLYPDTHKAAEAFVNKLFKE